MYSAIKINKNTTMATLYKENLINTQDWLDIDYWYLNTRWWEIKKIISFGYPKGNIFNVIAN